MSVSEPAQEPVLEPVRAGASVGPAAGAAAIAAAPPEAAAVGVPAPDDAGLGELASQYVLLAELGRGGSAVVYRARDRRLGREVALKAVRLAPALSERERASEVARLAREARTTARLDHPSIVTVYAVHELRDGLAVAMQYVPGRSLKQLLVDDGALEPGRAVRLLGEVTAALAYAHAHGVVHRDVKPENIFVDAASGRALLADFGAARAGESDVRVTRTGATVGTPAYMSPEQIDGGPLDGRADLYSLGLVAWETLTGRRPWAGAGLYQLLHHQKHDVLPPIAAVRPAELPPVPLALEYLVARLLEKRPAARWASAEVVAAQLEHPVQPADYKQWVREYRRRLAEHAAARASAVAQGPVSAYDRTEQLAPGEIPAEAATTTVAVAGPASDEDLPSWARPRATGRRRWLAGALAAAALAAVPAVHRWTADPPPVRRAVERTSTADGRLDLPTTVPPGAPTTGADAGADAGAAASAAAASGPAGSLPATADSAVHTSAVVAAGVTPGDTARRVVVVAALPGRPPVVAPAPAPAAARAPSRTAPSPPTSPPTSALVATPPPVVSATAAAPEGAARAVIFTERAIISAGGRHTCALDGAGRALCWGANESGQLGAGDLTARDAPALVEGELRFTQVATGGAHSCALTAAGEAYCWGEGDRGQLGDGSTSLRDAPARVAGGARHRTVQAGLAHTCGLGAGGVVTCWGANGAGQLGDGTGRDRATPATVPGLRAAALAVGWRHTCALALDGTALCWGDNASGQLGDGSRSARRTPVPVGGGRRYITIAAGASHTCATATDGATYCWGANGPDAGVRATPTRVEGAAAFVALAAGSVHTCGRTAAGQVLCWGRNPYGQLGDGTTADRWRPAAVAGGPYAAISAAGAHTCGVASGVPLCWGYNVSGQLGNGTRAHHTAPVRVTRTGS